MTFLEKLLTIVIILTGPVIIGILGGIAVNHTCEAKIQEACPPVNIEYIEECAMGSEAYFWPLTPEQWEALDES